MKIWEEGDRSKAACEHCKAVVTTTFMRRDFPLNVPSMRVKNLMVGVCDRCGATVSIPAQSTPAIARARKEEPLSVEANLPAIYVDVLDCAAHHIDSTASIDFRRILLTYFIHKAAEDARSGPKLKKSHERAMVKYPEKRGAARRRLSMKVPGRVSLEFKNLEMRTNMNTTELIKSVVYDIHETVLNNPKPAVISELRILSAVAT